MTVSRAVVEERRLENLNARGSGDVASQATQLHEGSGVTQVGHFRIASTDLPDKFVGMNKTEKRRAVELDMMLRRGDIVGWWYEAVTLKLGHDCRYTPDFMIQDKDGKLRFEEVKGFWRDDAKAKTKVVVQLFPFPLRVLSVRKGGPGWDIEEVKR